MEETKLEAINSLAVPVVRYSLGIIDNQSLPSLENLRTEKRLTQKHASY